MNDPGCRAWRTTLLAVTDIENQLSSDIAFVGGGERISCRFMDYPLGKQTSADSGPQDSLLCRSDESGFQVRKAGHSTLRHGAGTRLCRK